MKKYLLILTLMILIPSVIHAAGGSAGQTLLQASSARAASLGEAFSAVIDDIGAFPYNPSSLKSLKTSQASFLYQKGFADDAYGNFLVGTPLSEGSLGMMVSYYDGGKFDAWDGTQSKSINAKKDLVLGLGYGWRWGDVNLGFGGKYISSTLVESAKATAYAADFGFQYGLGKNLMLGGAIQNMGTSMTYVHDASPLPRVGRLGLLWNVPVSKVKLNLLADAPYYMNDSEVRPTMGAETWVGPLALRVGYQAKSDLQGLSFGAGFLLGQASIDYSYGFVQDLNATQRVSVSLKFGEPTTPNDKTNIQFSTMEENKNNPQDFASTQPMVRP